MTNRGRSVGNRTRAVSASGRTFRATGSRIHLIEAAWANNQEEQS